MSNKVNSNAANALLAGGAFGQGGHVVADYVYCLHRTKIAWVEDAGTTVCIFPSNKPDPKQGVTPTTMRAINAVLEVAGIEQRFHNKNKRLCLNGKPAQVNTVHRFTRVAGEVTHREDSRYEKQNVNGATVYQLYPAGR